MHCSVTLVARWGVSEPADAIVLPAAVKIAEKLDFDKSEVFGSVRMNYWVHICVGIASEMLRTTTSVFDTGDATNLVPIPFFPAKCPDCISPIHNMSLRSASNNYVNVIRKIMLLVQLGHLQVRVHFGVKHNLPIPHLIVTLFIDRKVEAIFLMGPHIVTIRFHPVAIISKYTPLSDPLERVRHWSHCGRLTGQQCKQTSGQSREVRRYTAEFQSVRVRYNEQRPTNLHGAITQFGANWNGCSGHRDWKYPAVRTDESLGLKHFEKPGNFA